MGTICDYALQDCNTTSLFYALHYPFQRKANRAMKVIVRVVIMEFSSQSSTPPSTNSINLFQ